MKAKNTHSTRNLVATVKRLRKMFPHLSFFVNPSVQIHSHCPEQIDMDYTISAVGNGNLCGFYRGDCESAYRMPTLAQAESRIIEIVKERATYATPHIVTPSAPLL